jgi:acyl carrier protein
MNDADTHAGTHAGTETSIEARLKVIFSAILGVPDSEIQATLSPETCAKWDSLNQIHLVNGIEEEFGVQLGFEDQLAMHSFGDAAAIVARTSGTV